MFLTNRRLLHLFTVAVRQLEGLIMATAAEANAKLDALGKTLDKISGETTGLVKQVQDLKDAAANAGVDQSVMDQIDSLQSKAASIDSLVDDVAPNPTPTPEPGTDNGGTNPAPTDNGSGTAPGGGQDASTPGTDANGNPVV